MMKKNIPKRILDIFKTLPALALIAAAPNAYSQCPTSISIDNTSVCFGDTLGELSLIQNIVTPIMITEVDQGSPDFIEIQNTTGASFDLTGYYVATSNSYTDINQANTLTWNLSGIVPAGWIDFREDATGANYWGNNLFYNPGSGGWVAICDASHNVVDIVFWEWTAADIANFAPVVAGNTLILDPTEWTGNGFQVSCSAVPMVRSTNLENNDATDWVCGTAGSPGVSNITITPITSDPIVSILWNTTDTTTSISGLTAGTYSIQVDYMSGCIGYDTISLASPAQIVWTSLTTDILCFGDMNGTASISPMGGTGTINIDWGSNNPNMLGQGYAPYMLIDSSGCTETDSVLINEPTLIDLNMTGQSILCFGDSTGSADVIASGGTPGYSYVWSTGDTTTSINNLSDGWYTMSVTDSNGCIMQDSVEVTEPTILTISGTANDEILGNDGSIDLTVSGGIPPYSFSWTNGAPAVEDPTGLTAGSYDVTVLDSNGCSITDTYIVDTQVGINELSQLQFSVFPNPNNGTFDILVDPSLSDFSIEVLNAVGQLVYTTSVTRSTHHVSLQFAEAGVYLVRLYNSKTSNVRRIVIK